MLPTPFTLWTQQTFTYIKWIHVDIFRIKILQVPEKKLHSRIQNTVYLQKQTQQMLIFNCLHFDQRIYIYIATVRRRILNIFVLPVRCEYRNFDSASVCRI